MPHPDPETIKHLSDLIVQTGADEVEVIPQGDGYRVRVVPEPMLTTAEAAARLNICPKKMRELKAAGIFKPAPLDQSGRADRYSWRDMQRILRELSR